MSRETRLIFISPTSDLTPDQITRAVHADGEAVTVKETCYGAVVEGERETVMALIERIRELGPNVIYTKKRGFPLGDPKRCRAHHGSRPGFSQLEMEWADLGKVEYGLECAQRGEQFEAKEVPAKLPVLEFQKICEEVD